MAVPWVAQVGPFTAAAANNIAQSQSPGAGAITLNGSLVSGGVATLDVPRRVLLTSGSSDTGITFTVNGTDRSGNLISETVTGGATTALTTQDFKTVTSVTHSGSVAGTLTIGTTASTTSGSGGVASTPWFMTNWHTNGHQFGLEVLASGTVGWTIEYTMENLFLPASAPAAAYLGYNISPRTFWATAFPFADDSVNYIGMYNGAASALRLTINSYTSTGSAQLVIIQPGLGFTGP